jgi:hypothetical protein
MIYEVIGVRTRIENQEAYSHGSAEMTQYELLLQGEDRVLYSFTAQNHYGDCPSGYTSATWGSFTPVASISELGPLHYLPLNPLCGEFTGPLQAADEDEPDYTAVFAEVGTGTVIAWSTGEGSCHYYPEGGAGINLALFTPTHRLTLKRKLFIFSGPSAVGKSFLAATTSLRVYETDQSAQLPKDITNYGIVVVGNKYGHTPAQVASLLAGVNVDLVYVHLGALPGEAETESKAMGKGPKR